MEGIVGIVLMIAGAIDFIVVPKVMVYIWNRSAQEVPQKTMILALLRLGGLTLIVAGALFRFGVFRLG